MGLFINMNPYIVEHRIIQEIRSYMYKQLKINKVDFMYEILWNSLIMELEKMISMEH